MPMSRFYGYRDKVVFPKVVQAEEGFYFDTDPVTICDTTDGARLRELVYTSLQSDNPVVATPERSEEHNPGSPLLEALQLKRWQRFEAEASMYSIYLNSDKLDYYCSGNAVNGHWRNDQMRHMTLDPSAGLDPLVEYILADLKADMLARRTSSQTLPTLLLPPPSSP